MVINLLFFRFKIRTEPLKSNDDVSENNESQDFIKYKNVLTLLDVNIKDSGNFTCTTQTGQNLSTEFQGKIKVCIIQL